MIAGVKFLGCAKNAPGGAWRIKNHSHSFREVIMVLRGSESVRVGGQVIEAGPGDALFFDKGVAHEEWSGPAPPLETIFFAFESGDENLFGGLPLLVRDIKGRLRLLAGWMLEDRLADGSAGGAAFSSFLSAFLGEARRLAGAPAGSSLLGLVRAAVTDNPAGDNSLDALAALAGMSKFHFLRKFKKLHGLTPANEVRAVRAGIAMSLLMTSNDPLKIIAHKTGLGGPVSLTRLFKKFYGKSPGSLKK